MLTRLDHGDGKVAFGSFLSLRIWPQSVIVRPRGGGRRVHRGERQRGGGEAAEGNPAM